MRLIGVGTDWGPVRQLVAGGLVKALCMRFEPGQRVRASRPARVGTTIAARTVVASEATMAAATPCFQTGCRWAVGVVALGVTRMVAWVVVAWVVGGMSGSVSSAGRPARPACTPLRTGGPGSDRSQEE